MVLFSCFLLYFTQNYIKNPFVFYIFAIMYGIINNYIIVMKKILTFTLVACSFFMFTSCKSTKESAYKKAYDSARIAEMEEGQGQETEPVEIAPVVTATKKVAGEADTAYRTESVVIASGAASALKAFSVVCGSFSSKSNADNLRNALVDEGYAAIVVKNSDTGMFRVICASFDTKEEAAESRAKFKADHPQNSDFQKAWLLYNK